MAPIISIAEVARPAEEAFAYVIDPRTMPEWRQGVERGNLDTPTTTVGSHCTTVRKIRGREREVVTEITEYEPPRRWADRGIEGPIRASVSVAVEPLSSNSRSRITIELDSLVMGLGNCSFHHLFVDKQRR